MAADETASAANYDFFRFHFATERPNEPGTLPGKRVASTRSKLHAFIRRQALAAQEANRAADNKQTRNYIADNGDQADGAQPEVETARSDQAVASISARKVAARLTT